MNNFYLILEKTAAWLKYPTLATAGLLRGVLICGLYLSNIGWATAQFNCSNPGATTMIVNYADWDWTIPTNHPNYCGTWTVQTTRGRFFANAPWIGSQNGELRRIYSAQDYTKEKGWELLRMDMGGRGARSIPYFFLYNKYRGIIRTFFYVNGLSAFPNGINITMSHSSSNGTRSSGILALSQPLVQSQNFYLQNQSTNNEIITYVAAFTAQDSWVFADFQVGFDSNAGNARYTNTALQFSVTGVTNSTIRLDGNFNFQTTQQGVQAGGYAIGGTAANGGASGLNNFLAKGQKVLKAFDYDDLTKFKSGFTAKASKTATTVAVPPVQAQQTALTNAVSSSSSAPGLFKKVTGIAGSLGATFGLVSTLIGVLWPDESAAAAPSFIPTVSSGTISLKGSISTTSPVTSVTMQLPGAQHFFSGTTTQTDGGDQPYYDCPLGIFNIKNTPQLEKYSFNMFYGSSCDYDWWNNQWTCTDEFGRFDCYRITNDLVPVYNSAAGLKLQSVQAALVAETPPTEFNKVVGPFSGGANPRTTPLPGFLLQRVYSGEAEVIAANDSLVTYATPFINLSSFKEAAITVARGSKVYIRVKAVLQRKDMPADAPPVFFVQDYAVQVSPGYPTNPRYSETALVPNSSALYANGEAPFTNLASALLVPTINPGAPNSTQQPEFTSTAPYLVPARTYWSDQLQVSSMTMISAGATALSPSSTAVTVQGVSGLDRALLLSNTGIALGPGFSVLSGAELVAATPLQAWRDGGPNLTEQFSGPCSYNSNTSYNPVAYRGGKPGGAADVGDPAVTADALTLSPNPTSGIVTLTTAVTGSGAVVVVSDGMGREVQRLESIPAGLSNQQINLSGRASGLYFARMTMTNGKSLTQKIVLQ